MQPKPEASLQFVDEPYFHLSWAGVQLESKQTRGPMAFPSREHFPSPCLSYHTSAPVDSDGPCRPLLVTWYDQYLIDQDVVAFVRQASEKYSVGSLERLVRHGQASARRAAVLALGRLADYRSNAVLGQALTDTDRGVRTLAETAIERLWRRVGTPAEQRRLAAIDGLLEESDYEDAAKLSGTLIQQSPWIAQAWYQRGLSYYQLGQHDAAIRDCHQALEINAYHYRAAAVMGQSYLAQNNLISALESFRRTLRLNPGMEDIRAQVIRLQRTLKKD